MNTQVLTFKSKSGEDECKSKHNTYTREKRVGKTKKEEEEEEEEEESVGVFVKRRREGKGGC